MASSSSTPKISSICVLCGSRLGKNKKFQAVSEKLGSLMASKKIRLVYESSLTGLIGNVSFTARFDGANPLRIVLAAVKQFLGKTIGKEIEVLSIQDRIPKMIEHSDAFIALPGALGTVHDMFLVAYWLSLSIHSKPIGLLNIDGFYDALLIFLDNSVHQGFMSKEVRQIFISDPDPECLIAKLEAFKAQPDPHATQIDWFGNQSRKRKPDLDLRLSL